MARSVEDYVIDFSKEESSGGGVRVKKGTYRVRIVAAKPITSSGKGTPGLELKLAFLDGNYRKQKKKLTEQLWASPKAYGRFRTLLEACGKRVPSKVNLIKIAKAIKGSDLWVEVDDDVREGYATRSRVTFEGFIGLDDYDPDAEADEDDDLDEDDEDDDVEDEDDEDEDDEDEDDDLDDEDEDEEPAPKKRSKRAAPAKKKAAPKKRAASKKRKADDEDEEEDLDELDLDEL